MVCVKNRLFACLGWGIVWRRAIEVSWQGHIMDGTVEGSVINGASPSSL